MVEQLKDQNQSEENPFVGPRAYEQDDCRFFFGRTTEISDIVHLVLASPVFFVYGDSDVGKTSLIRAGIGEWFTRHNVNWQYLECVADNPYEHVLNYLEQLGTKLEKVSQTKDDQTHVICFDTFEKVLDHLRENGKAPDFFQEITSFCREKNAHLLFVLRSEWFAHLDRYARLLPNRLNNRYRIDQLSDQSIEEVVIKIANKSSYHFDKKAAKWIVGKTKTKKKEDINLTILQVVCQKIWEKAHESERNKRVNEKWLKELDKKEPLVEGCLAEYFEKKLKDSIKAEPKDEVESKLRYWLSECIQSDGRRNAVIGPNNKKSLNGAMNKAIEELNNAIEELSKKHILRELGVSSQDKFYILSHDHWVKIIRESNEKWEAHNKVYLLGAESFKDPVKDEGIRKHVDYIARSIRKSEWQGEAFDFKSLPLDKKGDSRRHIKAQTYIGLMVLQGKVSFTRFDEETYKHLQWVRVRDAKELLAYLIWEREGLHIPCDEEQSKKYFFQACRLLKERIYKQNTRILSSDHSLQKLSGYIHKIVDSQSSHHPEKNHDNEGWANWHKIVKMKARQLQYDRGGTKTDVENWLDAEEYTRKFYESILDAIKQRKRNSSRHKNKISQLCDAIELGRRNALSSCFEAAILIHFVDVELLRNEGLDKIFD